MLVRKKCNELRISLTFGEILFSLLISERNYAMYMIFSGKIVVYSEQCTVQSNYHYSFNLVSYPSVIRGTGWSELGKFRWSPSSSIDLLFGYVDYRASIIADTEWKAVQTPLLYTKRFKDSSGVTQKILRLSHFSKVEVVDGTGTCSQNFQTQDVKIWTTVFDTFFPF